MAKAVRVGDTGTDHDGFPPTPVTAGSPDVNFDGIPAARVGDPLASHSKPKHPPHGRNISSGSSTVFINGKPAAITGGGISCGGVTIGGGTVNIGDAPSSVSSPPAPNAVSAKTQASRMNLMPSNGNVPNNSGSDLSSTVNSTYVANNPASIEAVTAKKNLETDVEETFLAFSDKRMSVETFAREVYLSDSAHIIEHIHTTNPHLRKSFGQIIPGMPLVVSPWRSKDAGEEYAIQQANELMDEFLKLSEEQRDWFAQHHETVTNALLVSAVSNLDVYYSDAESGDISPVNLTNILAGAGAVAAGAQVQGDRLSKRMRSFASYSKYAAEQTRGLSKQALYSHPVYKSWRKEARDFQRDMQKILSEIGKPGYIKHVQAKHINNYLNVGKRQLYKAKDFSRAVAGIDMTTLYKQSMSFSRTLGFVNGLIIGAGLYGNAKDVIQTCNANEWFEEKCNRSLVRNGTASFVNVAGGVGIGIALSLIPVTGGLSIAILAGGAFLWGMYGGEKSNEIGKVIEETIFD